MNTLFFGKKLIRLSTVDSTNNYAANLINTSNVPDGTVIMADFQEEGRGQRGKKWHSNPSENLMFSVIVKPKNFRVQDQFMLAKVVSIGLVQALREDYDIRAQVKWPNDIVFQGGKISGILMENGISGEKIRHSIAGIGFNVNQEKFPENLPAKSVRLLTGKMTDRMEVLESLLYHMERWYMQLNSGHFDRIDRKYEEWLLWNGQSIKFSVDGYSLSGIVDGVQRDGGIRVNVDGDTTIYYLGDIQLPGYDFTSTRRSAI